MIGNKFVITTFLENNLNIFQSIKKHFFLSAVKFLPNFPFKKRSPERRNSHEACFVFLVYFNGHLAFV